MKMAGSSFEDVLNVRKNFGFFDGLRFIPAAFLE